MLLRPASDSRLLTVAAAAAALDPYQEGMRPMAYHVYVSNAGSEWFSRFVFDEATGGLAPAPDAALPGTPGAVATSADGAVIVDADGNRYIDYIGSWGPMILGHRHPAVVAAIEKAMQRGTSFGAPTDLEITLAEMVIAAVPSVEMVRMVNSGTEATMSALRLARGFTGRDVIVVSEYGITPVTEAERRDALIGWVFSPLRMKDLMSSLISRNFCTTPLSASISMSSRILGVTCQETPNRSWHQPKRRLKP